MSTHTEDEDNEPVPLEYHARLRWVKLRSWDRSRDDVVRGIIPGYQENSPEYFKLQQLCSDARGSTFWIDVGVEE